MQSTLFVPQLPSFKAQVIRALKIGATDKIFLEFEAPFWDLTNPGFQFLWRGDEVAGNQINATNWVRSVFGFDSIINQPNMLVGWIAGPAAKYFFTKFIHLLHVSYRDFRPGYETNIFFL